MIWKGWFGWHKKIKLYFYYYGMPNILFFNFVTYPHWPSFTIGMNQTWLHFKKRSRKKIMNHVIFSQPTNTNYCLNMAISKGKKKSWSYGEFWCIFLRKNFCMSQMDLFGSPSRKIPQKQNTTSDFFGWWIFTHFFIPKKIKKYLVPNSFFFKTTLQFFGKYIFWWQFCI